MSADHTPEDEALARELQALGAEAMAAARIRAGHRPEPAQIKWEQLTPDIKAAWCAVARHVRARFRASESESGK